MSKAKPAYPSNRVREAGPTLSHIAVHALERGDRTGPGALADIAFSDIVGKVVDAYVAVRVAIRPGGQSFCHIIDRALVMVA